MAASAMPAGAGAVATWGSGVRLPGTLHVHVAFDWGEELDLAKAQELVPSRPLVLPRRARTPPSIAYRPPPLRLPLADVTLQLAELGEVQAAAEALLFDFAAVSVSLRIPFQLSPQGLAALAGRLAEADGLVQSARDAVAPVYMALAPAIEAPQWSEQTEEYFVFQMLPGGPLPPPEELLATHAAWLAGLARLEAFPLSPSEIAEALRARISYSPHDLLVLEWAAAVLIDSDCDETLQTIEFANLQLLEFRHIDERLDQQLAAAYRLIHPLTRGWFPFWRTHMRPLRTLGDLKIGANGMFERTGNVLKLVGDQYLARVYRLIAGRFHLDEWTHNIERSLDVVEGVYHVLSDQAATYRTELMELIVVLLIVFEIVMAFVGH